MVLEQNYYYRGTSSGFCWRLICSAFWRFSGSGSLHLNTGSFIEVGFTGSGFEGKEVPQVLVGDSGGWLEIQTGPTRAQAPHATASLRISSYFEKPHQVLKMLGTFYLIDHGNLRDEVVFWKPFARQVWILGIPSD